MILKAKREADIQYNIYILSVLNIMLINVVVDRSLSYNHLLKNAHFSY